MTRERALSVVERLVDAARRRDFAQLATCYAEDAVAVSPVFGEVGGRMNILATWQTLLALFGDAAVDISDLLVDGNRVAVLSRIVTTDRLGWFGRPATNSRLSYPLVLLLTIAGDTIVRDERIYDSAGVVDRLEKVRLDKELRTAAEVQRALLPRTTHAVAFCEAVADSVPCRAIGGDFFDFVDLPSGETGVVMGDVAGKGPAAALLASMLQGMFAVEAPTGGGPAATLARINGRLAARHVEARFATLVYAVIAPDSRLTYANAGHNPPVLLTGDGIRRLTTGGPILGMFGDARFDEEAVALTPGDTLVMFTDGVTEARSADDEEFGEERLVAAVTAARDAPAPVVLERVFDAVRAFTRGLEPADDITAAVVRLR